MLARSLRVWFSQGHKHLNHTEIAAKMKDLRGNIKSLEGELDQLKQEIKRKETETAEKNKVIHEKRIRLTEDVRKSEKVWQDAKKQSETIKAAAVQNFASSMIKLADRFNEIKKHENESHSLDLKEGFENTSRLFFNTLEKFNVKEIKVAVGAKVQKDQVEIVGEEKGTEKDHISKITEVGWEVNGKIIRKPKVIVTTL